MAFVDYYKILGVSKDIPQKDVKKAYLKRAKQFHPDLHQDDPKAKAKFQALTEAYEVIGDPEKRAKYDQYGENWKQAEAFGGDNPFGGANPFGNGNPFGSGNPFGGFGRGKGGADLGSIFDELFGGRGGFGGFKQPKETQSTVNIDFYTAMLGGEIIVALGDGRKLKMKVKPETQQGTKVRLKGKGANGADLIITYNVQLPTRLTERQRQLIQEMRRG